jgi:hypothetical protein
VRALIQITNSQEFVERIGARMLSNKIVDEFLQLHAGIANCGGQKRPSISHDGSAEQNVHRRIMREHRANFELIAIHNVDLSGLKRINGGFPAAERYDGRLWIIGGREIHIRTFADDSDLARELAQHVIREPPFDRPDMTLRL